MDDMQRVGPAGCADLERLAAAAATMGYSSDSLPIPAHHLPPSGVPATTLSPAIVPHYTGAGDPYDLSRAQQFAVARLAEYQPRAIYEHARTSHSTPTTQQQHTAHSHNRQPQFPTDRSTFASVSGRQQYSAIPVSITNNTIPSDVNTNANTSVVPLSQASIMPLPVSPVSQAASQAVMNFIQEGFPMESSSSLPPQDKKKKKVKKPGILKDKKPKPPAASSNVADTNGKWSFLNDIPAPVQVDGRKYYICALCDMRFIRKYQFRRHLIAHTGEKRGALSLEKKVEIIRRIQDGEKQVDLAMEYGVGRSTLSFIAKNSEKFLLVWKNGKFHPDTKRMRGPKREDVEEALYEWFKQALHMDMPVSGPILCQKAKDFALKLGYTEFKATHGWLDRFKHRKNIILGRGKHKDKDKDKHDEVEISKADFTGQVLPSALMEYETNDVFHADEIGLLYRILPNNTSTHKGDRCAGGSKSKHRVTILMCTNMTGTEKFPLLVIGKHPRPKCFKNVKSLPVQYLANPRSWMTTESFIAWLHDLDSWFVQQNRKVLLILPNRPIHPKAPKLNAVKLLISPSTFIGPCKLGIAQALKRNYRRAVLETLINLLEDEDLKRKKKIKHPTKLNLLACLHLLAAAWHAVTDVTINNSFQRSGIGKFALWGMNLLPENNLGTENLELIHKLRSLGFKIQEGTTFDDFVMFDDEIQVCHLMDDEDIIATVTGAILESSDSEEEEPETEKIKTEPKTKSKSKVKVKGVKKERVVKNDTAKDEAEDISDEMDTGPSMSEVDASLDTIRQHIQYQEGAQEMFRVLAHLEFLIHKGTAGNRRSLGVVSTDNS